MKARKAYRLANPSDLSRTNQAYATHYQALLGEASRQLGEKTLSLDLTKKFEEWPENSKYCQEASRECRTIFVSGSMPLTQGSSMQQLQGREDMLDD